MHGLCVSVGFCHLPYLTTNSTALFFNSFFLLPARTSPHLLSASALPIRWHLSLCWNSPFTQKSLPDHHFSHVSLPLMGVTLEWPALSTTAIKLHWCSSALLPSCAIRISLLCDWRYLSLTSLWVHLGMNGFANFFTRTVTYPSLSHPPLPTHIFLAPTRSCLSSPYELPALCSPRIGEHPCHGVPNSDPLPSWQPCPVSQLLCFPEPSLQQTSSDLYSWPP